MFIFVIISLFFTCLENLLHFVIFMLLGYLILAESGHLHRVPCPWVIYYVNKCGAFWMASLPPI